MDSFFPIKALYFRNNYFPYEVFKVNIVRFYLSDVLKFDFFVYGLSFTLKQNIYMFKKEALLFFFFACIFLKKSG